MTTVVGIDVGYRNLGWVRLTKPGGETEGGFPKIEGLQWGMWDLGLWSSDADMLARLLSRLQHSGLLVGVDHLVIEDQQMGRGKTLHRMHGLGQALGMAGLLTSPKARLSYLSSQTKFRRFSRLQLPHDLPDHKQKAKRRRLLKANAVFLARQALIQNGHDADTVFIVDRPEIHEHLADALGLALCA